MFQVTTILPEPHEPIGKIPTASKSQLEKGDKKEKKEKKDKKKKEGEGATEDGKEEVKTDEASASQTKQEPPKPEQFHEKLVNYKKDLFGKPSFLTVSGQLSVENYCCALSDVYTFGPTFRAENSHTSRHLAEFWMIEPELAFATLEDDMACAEDYLKFCLQYVMTNNLEELKFFD